MCVYRRMWGSVLFVEFYDVLAALWFIFGLDSAALVLSGYVLFSFVHLFRHLTCPEINTHTSTHTHFHTQEATGQRDVFTPQPTGFTPSGSNNSSLLINQSFVVLLHNSIQQCSHPSCLQFLAVDHLRLINFLLTVTHV